MSAKRGLGRSFDSLLPTDLLNESFDPTASQDSKVSELRNIAINEIYPDADQPRKHFDSEALDELSDSVREHGIIQPIVVTPRSQGGYTIVAGERRFRAANQAGLKKIPSLVRTLSDQHKLELSLIENIQRHDLSAIETATAYLKLRDQFNLTMEEIGKRVGGKSPSAVNNTMRLLQLPESVQKAIVDGRLTEGQARPLIKMPTDVVEEMLPRIISEGWSARRIEQVAAHMRGEAQSEKPRPVRPIDEAIVSRTTNFSKAIEAPVSIKQTKTGNGRLEIGFKDQTDLTRLLDLLSKTD